jgi:hypothetical protein
MGLPKFEFSRGLLQVDGTSIPLSSIILNATLRVFVTDTTFDPLNLPITVASLAAAFDESTVDFATQPAIVPGQETSALMNAMAGEFFDIDVTNLVIQQLQTHPSFVGLRLAASNESGFEFFPRFFDFSSKESPEGGAQLLLTFGNPAPALSPGVLVFAFALLLAIAWLALRRAGSAPR